MTATDLNAEFSEIKSKIPNTSGLVTTTVLITKISEVENKLPDHSKCIITQEFNKLTAENFAARLKKARLVIKTDSDNKLTSFIRKITSNKGKSLEVLKKINSPTTKDYNFFLGRMHLISNYGSQNTFVYQPLEFSIH